MTKLFFLHSQKGSKEIVRESRKRGRSAEKKGISDEQVATIVTMGRNNSIDLEVACLGRISKKDIEAAIGTRVTNKTVLCSDGHVSYKRFAFDQKLEHHVLRGNLKEFVKEKKFHIQHVNSAHSRLKTWINNKLYGVATKYLQNYLNLFRINEKFKLDEVMTKLIQSALISTGLLKYQQIPIVYERLMHKSQKT